MASANNIESEPKVFIVPASFSQRRLWFLHQFESSSPAYHLAAAVQIDGVLNLAALRKTLQDIVSRHESLRTRFKDTNGEPYQVIDQEVTLDLPVKDLRLVHRDAQRDEVEKLAREEAWRPFDLSKGPLIRTSLLKLDNEEHILLLTMHHIISDGWSVGILIQELAVLYEAFLSNRPSPLAELPIQYADFSEWQRAWMGGKLLDQQLEYWTKQLDNVEPLELPTTYIRLAAMTYAGATLRVDVPADVLGRLRALCKQEGATLYMVLLASFQTLLYRYSGQTDIAVGTPIAGRKRPETERLFGFFVNTLVVRTKMIRGWTFVELLKRVKDTLLDAYTYQDVPFEKVVEAMAPSRDLARSPLFQVMFTLQNTPQGQLRLKGARLQRLNIDYGISKFEIGLTLEESGEELSGALEYNTDLFDSVFVGGMIRHYYTLLNGLINNPQQQICHLPLLTTEERRQVLVDWNKTKTNYALDQPLMKRFEAQAARRGSSVAVSSDNGRLTYAALDGRSNQLGHYLKRMGVGPEVPIGLFMERGFEMVLSLCGILKAGGAYVPLDPSYPPERLGYMADDVQVKVLLTQEKLVGDLKEYAGKVVRVDSDWPEIAKENTSVPSVEIGPQNAMYVIYTSGSTGLPKGVMLNHGAVVNHMLWMEREFQVGADDRVLQKTPLTFDVSAWEIFLPLITGGELVLAQPGGHRDNVYIRDLIQERGVTIAYFVASMLESFLEEKGIGDCRSLRYIFCGGEAMPLTVPSRLFEKLNVGLCNIYGPTETCIDSTFWRCTARDWNASSGLHGIPIGKGIDNTQLYVLDEEMQPVPIGVPGELYIGGEGVGRGYWKRADATAELFLPDWLSDKSGARLYRTGDWVRWKPDGNLEYTGRRDEQVKIRGFRIELGEIESELGKCEGVRQAVVAVRQDSGAGPRLVAYIAKSKDVQRNELWQRLRQRLPEYMVPSTFVLLDQLPLTPNGKVDRRALPVPTAQDERQRATYTAPRTATEKQLAKIWSEVLGLQEIGVEDNFFEVGGHSLLATQVVARTNTVFHVELQVRKVFESPTLAQLALVVEQLQAAGGADTDSTPQITRVPRKAVRLPADSL
jgi:amino acid adenylation domain-containing protein